MKIFQIMDTLTSTGGVNTFVFDLCIALKRQGEDVTLIGLIGDRSQEATLADYVKKEGIPVYCLWFSSKKEAVLHGVRKLRRLVKSLSNGEPSVCNLHLKLSVLIGGISTWGLRNIKCVETYHAYYRDYWLEYKLMRFRIKKYIGCSCSATKEFVKRFCHNERFVVCIPNGIDAENLKNNIGRISRREKKNAVFLSVGRLTEQKNLHITAEAFSRIDPQRGVYRIIGKGPMRDAVVNASKGSSSVEFLGTVPRSAVVDELFNADMVVMPSLWEGLSIFMLEAIAMEKPMMIADVESLRDVLDEPQLEENEAWRRCSWGYLVSTSNSRAYFEAAEDFLNHPDYGDKMSESIGKFKDRYSIETTARDYAQLYNELIRKT